MILYNIIQSHARAVRFHIINIRILYYSGGVSCGSFISDTLGFIEK